MAIPHWSAVDLKTLGTRRSRWPVSQTSGQWLTTASSWIATTPPSWLVKIIPVLVASGPGWVMATRDVSILTLKRYKTALVTILLWRRMGEHWSVWAPPAHPTSHARQTQVLPKWLLPSSLEIFNFAKKTRHTDAVAVYSDFLVKQYEYHLYGN